MGPPRGICQNLVRGVGTYHQNLAFCRGLDALRYSVTPWGTRRVFLIGCQPACFDRNAFVAGMEQGAPVAGAERGDASEHAEKRLLSFDLNCHSQVLRGRRVSEPFAARAEER